MRYTKVLNTGTTKTINMAKRKTIKGCEERIKELEKLSNGRQELIFSRGNQIDTLQKEIRTLESENLNIKMDLETNKREKQALKDKLISIVEVLAGEASPQSKAEVITDLLSFRVGIVKEEKERRKQCPHNIHNPHEAFF